MCSFSQNVKAWLSQADGIREIKGIELIQITINYNFTLTAHSNHSVQDEPGRGRFYDFTYDEDIHASPVEN